VKIGVNVYCSAKLNHFREVCFEQNLAGCPSCHLTNSVKALKAILQHNLSKFITQMGLYCSKQLATNFHQFCEKPMHITFKYQGKEDLL